MLLEVQVTALPPWRHVEAAPQRWRNSAMFSPEMMKQAQNMMANMSPEVRLGFIPSLPPPFGVDVVRWDVSGVGFIAGMCFFLFRHRKRNRRTRGWWRPNCERWMNIPRIGLMNIPTTFRKSWDGHSPQKWRDFITLVFIQDLVWLLPGLELRDWLVQSAILVEFPCNCHELIWIVLHTTSYICWSKKASWTANSCWIQDMQKMTQMAANMDPSVMEPR